MLTTLSVLFVSFHSQTGCSKLLFTAGQRRERSRTEIPAVVIFQTTESDSDVFAGGYLL